MDILKIQYAIDNLLINGVLLKEVDEKKPDEIRFYLRYPLFARLNHQENFFNRKKEQYLQSFKK